MTINKPRAILERLAFLCFLALFIGSCGLAGLGVIFGMHGELRPVCLGAAGLMLFVALRPLGYKHLHFREWEDSFEPSDAQNAAAFDGDADRRAQELCELFVELARLKTQLATGGGDVWSVQAVRHQAAALVAHDPSLREAFAEELSEHGIL